MLAMPEIETASRAVTRPHPGIAGNPKGGDSIRIGGQGELPAGSADCRINDLGEHREWRVEGMGEAPALLHWCDTDKSSMQSA